MSAVPRPTSAPLPASPSRRTGRLPATGTVSRRPATTTRRRRPARGCGQRRNPAGVGPEGPGRGPSLGVMTDASTGASTGGGPRTAWGHGLATITEGGTTLDTWYPDPQLGPAPENASPQD